MSKIEQLYQETILAHNHSPRNFYKMAEYSHSSIGRNPLCGDVYQIFVRFEEDCVAEISFWGEGCAISKASSSIMSELVKGKSLTEAARYKDIFLQLLLAESEEEQEAALAAAPRKLQIFRGVRRYPMRVKCATLIWRALEAVLQNSGQASGCAVSTE